MGWGKQVRSFGLARCGSLAMHLKRERQARPDIPITALKGSIPTADRHEFAEASLAADYVCALKNRPPASP